MIATLLAAYLAAALLFAVYAFRYGAGDRPGRRYRTDAELVILGATALLAGLAWLLFVPALLLRWKRSAALPRSLAALFSRVSVKKTPATKLSRV